MAMIGFSFSILRYDPISVTPDFVILNMYTY